MKQSLFVCCCFFFSKYFLTIAEIIFQRLSIDLFKRAVHVNNFLIFPGKHCGYSLKVHIAHCGPSTEYHNTRVERKTIVTQTYF